MNRSGLGRPVLLHLAEHFLATCQQPMVVPCSHEKFMRFRDFLPYPVCFFSLAQPYLNVSADPVPSFASLQVAPQEASAIGDQMIKDMGWRLFWEPLHHFFMGEAGYKITSFRDGSNHFSMDFLQHLTTCLSLLLSTLKSPSRGCQVLHQRGTFDLGKFPVGNKQSGFTDIYSHSGKKMATSLKKHEQIPLPASFSRLGLVPKSWCLAHLLDQVVPLTLYFNFWRWP